MAKTTIKLPHGLVPTASIKDDATRDAIRKLAENIVALKRELEERKLK